METFPIVDISSLHPMSGDYNVLHEQAGKKIAKELGESLGKFGFIYLKGYGIDNTQVERVFSVSKKFFKEHQNVCRHFIRTKGLGYTSGKNEKFLKKKNSNLVVAPDDIKHAYDVVLKSPQFEAMPGDVKEGLAEVIEKLQRLSRFMLRLICLALGKDEGELIKGHTHIGNYSKNPSLFRTTYYPELKQPPSLNQFRISEHTDFGTFTMLFQDDCGGLEVGAVIYLYIYLFTKISFWSFKTIYQVKGKRQSKCQALTSI